MRLSSVRHEFPPKLEPIFGPARYKVIRGGRGSGKSWGVARALLLLGLERPLRVLCTRETQKSIRDSVHKLLVDQIARMGLAAFYRIQQVQITGANGTEFIFAGMSDLTAESIKSFEGADVVWVEEGQSLTDRSWTILIPTIRKEGSEIWVTFNPELDNDPTWVRFIEKAPPNCISVEMNWRDNPWFTKVLEDERLHAKATLKDYEYEWIWEGKCKPAITGAIYADDLAQMYQQNRIREVTFDAAEPVYAVFDLGWNESTAIGICQRVISQMRVIDYIEDTHKTPDDYTAILRNKPYHVAELFLPHDGHKSDVSGQTPRKYYERLRWKVNVLPASPIEDGIKACRVGLRSTYIDKEKCSRLIDCLKRYRRVIPPSTSEPAKPMHDQYSHGADMMRYMMQAAPMMDNDIASLPKLNYGKALV